MLRAFRTSGLRFSIAALYALAALFVSLSHRPVAAAQVDSQIDSYVDLSAYAIPGAVGPILCLSSENDDGIGKAAPTAGPCEACRLTAALGLASVPDADHLVVRFGIYVAHYHAADVAPNDLSHHDYRSRAPPGVS